jgi:hypothetical protein
MKKLIIVLFSIFLFSAHAHATDPYWDGYDDAKEGQGEWSNNDDYLDGYEDAQRQKENEERIERECQEREEQRQREEEQRSRNKNWLND